MLVPVSPFRTLDVRRRPPVGRQSVTKRQSAMISLRASAVLAKAGHCLRVPIRLSAVRARYHNASAPPSEHQKAPSEFDHAAWAFSPRLDPWGTRGSAPCFSPGAGLASPCSRRCAPLHPASLVSRPPVPAFGRPEDGSARHGSTVAHGPGQHLMKQISAVSTPTPTLRASSRTIAWCPVSCSCSNVLRRASSISLIWLTTKPAAPYRAAARPKHWAARRVPSGGFHGSETLDRPRLREQARAG